MQMVDQGLADEKILAVAEQDASVAHIQDVSQMPPHFTHELKEFFETYKKLEKKVVTVPDFQGKQKAMDIIEKAMAYYQLKKPV
jgi:inorganic pyrophosphatase